jgi:uncharacterized protein YjiS (DUF1127 family)
MANYLTSLFRRADRRRALNELSTLDDRMLADIGLTRGDLAHLRGGRRGETLPGSRHA